MTTPAEIRALLKQSIVRPTSEAYIEQARILQALIPGIVDQLHDDDIMAAWQNGLDNILWELINGESITQST